MIRRQVLLPAGPQRVWTEITDPEAVSEWLGARVRWDLTPGGPARFDEDGGTGRNGQVDEVLPLQRLRFRWWPEDGPADAASEVTIDLSPRGGDTELTVTERLLPMPAPVDVDPPPAVDSAEPVTEWSPWDSRMLGMWRCTSRLAGART